MPQAEFRRDDGKIVLVQVKRRGPENSRVIFADGHEELVPNGLLRPYTPVPNAVTSDATPGRLLVPETPLRRFYKELRKLGGPREERFNLLRQHLQDRHGPKGATFLAELFARSQAAMEFYRNPRAPFYERGRRTTQRDAPPDARLLVDLISNGSVAFEDGCRPFEYVDYEICPTRTTQSCLENGKAARSSGGGGMDILLLSTSPKPLPAVGEIKAASEYVGPTFALIQGLTYAAELVTKSQWDRLGNAFDKLRSVCTADRSPQVDVLVLLQHPSNQTLEATADIDLAMRVSQELIADPKVSSAVRSIEFLTWEIKNASSVVFARVK
jgi:hypothetical protein